MYILYVPGDGCDDQYDVSDRYCLAVTVIGFAYSAFQVYNLSYQLVTGKYAISHHLRRHFDFLMDQVSRAAYPSVWFCIFLNF